MVIESIGAWLWEKYSKDISDIAISALKSRWEKFKWREAAEHYRIGMRERFSEMRMLYKYETVPISELYVDLFVHDRPTAHRRYGKERLQAYYDETGSFQNSEKRTSALRVVTQYDKLFILGKPGTGKTTLLKYLIILASENKIEKVPIFISFNAWAHSGKDLLNFIAEQFEICRFPNAMNFIKTLLQNGDAMVLLDGLDEVSEESDQRRRQVFEVENLIIQYPENKYLITCRNAASDYVFEGSTYVEMADFTHQQIQSFSANWFGENRGEKFVEELDKVEYQNLRELAQTPLLLGLLCLVFDETSRLPQQRVELYQEAIDALLRRWDKERGIKRDAISINFDPPIEQELLSTLAYNYFSTGEIFFKRKDLEEKLTQILNEILEENPRVDGYEILDAIESQHGLLVKRAHNIYSFSHLTFQEYFTASYISSNIEKEMMNELFRHLFDSRWREIFLLTSNLIPDPESFFSTFQSSISNLIKGDKKILTALKYSNKIAPILLSDEPPFISRMVALATILSIEQFIREVRILSEKSSVQIVNSFFIDHNIDIGADIREKDAFDLIT